MLTLTDRDRELLIVAGTIAQQVAEQIGRAGHDPEETWVLLAIAARVAERAVIEADRRAHDLRTYAAAQARLRFLLQVSDENSDAVEAEHAARDGVADPIRS